ncbi:MAG: hypothetical protein U9M98_00225 [Patescibacteria group bacterium]|nr:hypothetical protein [Patescibacteria group bacterium]
MKKTLFVFIFYGLITLFFLRGVLFFPGQPAGGDWGFPFTPAQVSRYFESNLYTWTDTQLFGSQQYFLNGLPFRFLTLVVTSLGITCDIYAKILLIVAFVFPALSMYALCNFLGCDRKESFLGGLFYITFPFVFNYIAMGWLFVLFSMGILPLAVVFFIKSVEDKNIFYAILTGVLYFLAMIQSQTLIWYPLVFLSLSIFFVGERERIFSYVKSFLVVLLVFSALNTYLWLPLFLGEGSGVVSTKLALSPGSLGTWARLSYPNVLRAWGSLFNYQYESSYPVVLTPFSFFIPVLAYSSLFLVFGKKKKIVLSFAALSFIPLFLLILGPDIIVKLPFSDIIRDAGRFSVLSSFSYVVMAILTLRVLFKQAKGHSNIFKIGLIIVLAINTYPFWSGALYGEQEHQYDIRLRGYEFPLGYTSLEESLKNKRGDIKVLYLPIGGSLNIVDDKRFYGPFKEIQDIFAALSPKPGVITINDRDLGAASKLIFHMRTVLKSQHFNTFDSLLPLMNVRYIAVRENVKHSPGLPGKGQTILLSEKTDLNMENRWSRISLLKNERFIPHFYVPRTENYVVGEVSILSDVLDILESPLRTSMYIVPLETMQEGLSTPILKKKRTNVLTRADSVLVEASLFYFDSFDEVLEWGDGWVWPEVSVDPDSWKYPAVKIKERWVEFRAGDSLAEADVLIWHASKKIAEIEKFNPAKAKAEKLLENYLEKAGRSVDVLKSVPEEERDEDYWGMVNKVLAYTDKAEEKIAENTDGKSEEIRKLRDDFRGWVEEEGDFWCPEEKYCYEVGVPEGGLYTLYIDKNTLRSDSGQADDTDKGQIEQIDGEAKNTDNTDRGQIERINAEVVNLEPVTEEIDGGPVPHSFSDGGWVSYGEYEFEESEGQKIVLDLPEMPNLVGTDLRDVSFSGFLSMRDRFLRDEIQDWQAGENYKLSFDYTTLGGGIGVAVFEETFDWEKLAESGAGYEEVKDDPEFFEMNTIFRKELQSPSLYFEEEGYLDSWESFETELEPSSYTRGATLLIYAVPDEDGFTEAGARDVSVQRILEPKLVLRKDAENADIDTENADADTDNADKELITRDIPNIKFIRVNPTKYKIQVSGATEAYPLVFSESFHDGWKVYADNTDGETDNAERDEGKIGNSEEDKGYGIGNNITRTFWSVLGRGLAWITDLFLDNGDYGEEVASYFDGEIREGTHRNTFMEPATFETWGKKPIEAEHIKVNGYANSWYIDPTRICADADICTENADGSYDMELVVEFFPQRLFYLGLLISSLTLVGCVSYLGFAVIKGKKDVRNS